MVIQHRVDGSCTVPGISTVKKKRLIEEVLHGIQVILVNIAPLTKVVSSGAHNRYQDHGA